MDKLFELNRDIFVPNVSILEMVLRGTIMYIALFLLMRFTLRRQSGTLGVTDVLVVVLIADASQNAMTSDYTSIPEGLALVVTILFWAYAVDWLGFHVPAFAKLVHQPPLELIRDGRILRQNLRRELITIPELESQLREQGIQDASEVKTAFMEGDGSFSVVKVDSDAETTPAKKRKGV